MQAVKDLLKNVETNKEEYYSTIHPTGFFSLPTDQVQRLNIQAAAFQFWEKQDFKAI